MAEKKKETPQNNLRFYELLRAVPPSALKIINAGRLKGMSDINPVWRIKAMTEAFGPCGIGWKYEIVKQWQEAFGQEVKAFTNLNLYIKVDGAWSEPIPGTGGATLVEINSKGCYVNDEGFKMSLTDAMSVCMRSLGVAADVYFSKDKAQFDTKYDQQAYAAQRQQQSAIAPQPTASQPAVPTRQSVGIQQILAEIAACNSTDALKAVWTKYPQMQSSAQFTGALTARKDQILNNGKR